MATSNSGKPTPARARRATTQTIEQIEARAAAIDEAERDSLRRLAAFLRDLAVELPVESKLPLQCADAAKTLDQFARPSGTLMAAGFDCAVDGMIRDLQPEFEARAVDEVVR